MPIIDKKITLFAKKVADLADKPNQGGGMTAAQVKAQFDSAPEELRVAHNGLVDALVATTVGDSGAHNVGSDVIAGVTGDTVYEQMASLKALLDNAATGDIPDGSLGPEKLSATAKSAQSITVSDVDNRFTATNVEGALSELFTFANDGKTQVAGAVTAKGVAASSTDSFSTLATKIGQINTGRRTASGNFAGGNIQHTETGLAFRPTIVFLYTRATNGSYETQVIFGDANQSSIKTDTSKIITSIKIYDTNDTTNQADTASSVTINGTTEYAFSGSSYSRNNRVTNDGFEVFCQFNTTHYWVAYE